MHINLANYIEQAKKSGMSNKRIYEGLLLTGWGHGNPSPFNSQKEQSSSKPQWQMASIQKKIAIFFLVALILLFGAFIYVQKLARENYDKVSAAALEAQHKTEEIKQKRQNSLLSPLGQLSGMENWQTYRNDEYGFEFKYPDNYPIRQENNRIVLLKIEWQPHANYFDVNFKKRIIIEKGNKDETLLSIAKENICQNTEECIKYIKKLRNIGEGMLIEYTDGITYYNYNDDVLIRIDAASSSLWQEDNDDFDQILSTFRFIPSTSSGQGKSVEGQFCGGIAAFQCLDGYICKLDDDYPDAGGKCVRPEI